MSLQKLPATMDLGTGRGMLTFYRTVRDQMNKGASGTITIDDGANWRLVLTFEDGKLIGATSGSSTSAGVTIDLE